jgi:hypothetical protein
MCLLMELFVYHSQVHKGIAMSTIEKIWSRPGLYLSAYEQTIDAASFFINFLIGVFDYQDFGIPDHIDISVAGKYFSVTATGCYLQHLDTNPDLFTQLFTVSDTDLDKVIEDFPGLSFIRPIVWFADFCLVDISTVQTVFRQVFSSSQHIAPVNHLPLIHDKPYIGFLFTLPHDRFTSTSLDNTRLRRVLSSWQKMNYKHAKSQQLHLPYLKMQWREQSIHQYSVRITPSHRMTS